MSRISGIISSLLLISTIPACSRVTDENREHYFRVFEEGGVTIAETSGIPKYEGELFRYEKVLELQEDERPESLLNRPTDFLMDSQGRFYVADSGDARIAIFSPEGVYLSSFGRRGEGPGEFMLPRIQFIRDDILSIFDLRHRREMRYRTDGTLLDITTIPSSHTHWPNEFFHLDEERMVQIIRQSQDIENETFSWVEVLIHTVTSDTVALFTTDRVLTGYRYPSVHRGYQVMQRGNYIFASQPIAFYSPPHGFVMSAGDDPVLNIRDTDGTLQKKIRVDMAREQVTRTDKEEVVAVYEREMSGADEDIRSQIEEQIENLRFTEYKPPWYAFVVDDIGYFWLLDIDSIDMQNIPEHGVEMMVLDPEGEYLGRSTLPPAMLLKFSNGRLLVTNQDQETGEYSLTVYEIQPAVEGFKYP